MVVLGLGVSFWGMSEFQKTDVGGGIQMSVNWQSIYDAARGMVPASGTQKAWPQMQTWPTLEPMVIEEVDDWGMEEMRRGTHRSSRETEFWEDGLPPDKRKRK